MRHVKKGALATVAALIVAATMVGSVYALTLSGTDFVGGYSLYSAMGVTDLSAGNYRGDTYAEALSTNVDTLYNVVWMEEICNGSASTDYYNDTINNNVSWSSQTSPTVGYATGFFDCPLSQGIRNWGFARWVDSSPVLDHQRTRVPCINVRAGGAC
ncbi:MAG: hypothetical protein M0R73_10560 [Dehalococcoidia bacterium]|nr:hypothetical protein [Dehalococcoidia bacterium]